MWELQLLDLFRYYLPAIIFVLICGVLILHFRRTREKGYLAISIGFILLTIGWLSVPTITQYSVRELDLLGATYSVWPWIIWYLSYTCLLYTSPSPRDGLLSRMPSSA